MSFFDANKQITGFDIEFASRIAQKLGKKLLITDMEFGAMIPALISGKVDMIGAGLSITAEKGKESPLLRKLLSRRTCRHCKGRRRTTGCSETGINEDG